MKRQPKPSPVTYYSRPKKGGRADTGLQTLTYNSLCGRYALIRCRSPHFGEYWLAVVTNPGGSYPLREKTKSRKVADAAIQSDNRICPKPILTKARIMNAATTTAPVTSATPNTDASKKLLARLEANHPLPVSLSKTMEKPAERLINAGIAEVSKQANLAVLRLTAAHAPKPAAASQLSGQEGAAKVIKHQNPRMAAQKMMAGRIKANKAKLAAGETTKKELTDAAKAKVTEQLKIEGSAPVDILSMIPKGDGKAVADIKAATKSGKGKPAAKTTAVPTAAVERPKGTPTAAELHDIYLCDDGAPAALLAGRKPPHNATWFKSAKLLGQVWAVDRPTARQVGKTHFADKFPVAK